MVNTMTNDVYFVYGASGEWEDYHEYIMYMFDNRKSAIDKMEQLRLEQKKDLDRWNELCKQVVGFDREHNMDDMWSANCQKIYFDEYLDDPEKYQDYLQLFTPPERQLIIEYTKLDREFESLGGVAGLEVNDVSYFVREYLCSHMGEMELKETIYNCEE